MGRQKIIQKVWQRATNVLLWYWDNKAEYEVLREELSTREPGTGGTGGRSVHSDPTGETAIRLHDDPRLQLLERETRAVEEALERLPEAERVVIQCRYLYKPYVGGFRKPRRFDEMWDLGFSERTMHRICRKTLLCIAMYLGEIRRKDTGRKFGN